MPGRSARDAHESFFTAYQRAIACVSRTAVVVTTGIRQRSEPHTAFLNRGASVPLQGEGSPQFLLRFEYTIGREAFGSLWGVQPQGYWYELDLADGRELLAFHWHPHAKGAAASPHLHLGPATGITYRRLAAAHIPTGPLFLQTVLEFAIDELSVEAQRTDWREVLRRARLAMESG